VDSYSILLERSRILLNQGRVDDAIKEIRSVLQQKPDSAEALSLYARCHFHRNEYDLGIEKAKEALGFDPENAYYYYLMGFAYYRKSSYNKAISFLNKAITMAPYAPEYYGLLSQVFISEKQFEKALNKANEGLELDPENLTCLNARSTSLNKLNRTDDAIETMQFALSKDPENDFTHLTVAWNYLEKGNYKESTKHFKESLRLNPRSTNAQIGLKEALKSKIPPFRWMLQYSYWVSNKGKRFSRFLPIGIFVGVRLLFTGLASNDTTKVIAYTLIAVYFGLVIFTWLITPIANFFLVFDQDGKYALTNDEKWSSILVVSSIFLGLCGIGIGSLLKGETFVFPVLATCITLFLMAIPLSQMTYPIRWKGTKKSSKIALVIACLGILTIFSSFLYQPALIVFGLLFLIGIALNSWFPFFAKP